MERTPPIHSSTRKNQGIPHDSSSIDASTKPSFSVTSDIKTSPKSEDWFNSCFGGLTHFIHNLFSRQAESAPSSLPKTSEILSTPLINGDQKEVELTTHMPKTPIYIEDNFFDLKEPLGEGAFNKVYLLGEPPPPKVLKPVFQGVYDSDLAGFLGIDSNNPQFDQRSIASSGLSKKLFNALTDDKFCTTREGPCVLTDYVPGKSPLSLHYISKEEALNSIQKKETRELAEKKLANINWLEDMDSLNLNLARICQLCGWQSIKKEGNEIKIATHETKYAPPINDPIYRRKMTELQFEDLITGQGDRHAANILIQTDNKGDVIELKGIDNDCAFGENEINFENLLNKYKIEDCGWNGAYGLPSVADEDMYKSIMALTIQDLHVICESNGLSQKSYAAACKRLETAQNHMQTLQKQDRIIKRTEWNTSKVKEWLLEKNSDDNPTNYVGRDVFACQKEEKFWNVGFVDFQGNRISSKLLMEVSAA